jgi:thiol-disulfide isomerase/thioredoxin
VLLDMWAPWCGPCRLIAPVIEQLATELAGLKVTKLNTEKNSMTSSRFNVRCVPTPLALKDGGDIAASRMAYEQFFAVRNGADSDLPILAEARKEYKRIKITRRHLVSFQPEATIAGTVRN